MTDSSVTSFPIFDGHNDMLLRVRAGGNFLGRDAGGHLDLERARLGGLAGGFCAIFVRSPGEPGEIGPPPSGRPGYSLGLWPATPELADAQQEVVALLALFLHLERESGARFQIVRTAAEIEDCFSEERFAALMHIEGAEAIDPELNALEVFHAAGVRSLGPVWSRPNAFGHGVPFTFPGSPDSGPGLTDLGRDLIRACNRLRMVVDLSHITEQGFWDVAALTDAPLIATHSNAHALSATPRNLTDRQLDAIRESGGMVGVNFAVGFLRKDGAPDPTTPLDAIVRHVDYLADRMGIDRVGFGSDFDGAMIPAELGDVAGLPRLIEALRRGGYDDMSLRKLCHQNWVRVLRQTWGG